MSRRELILGASLLLVIRGRHRLLCSTFQPRPGVAGVAPLHSFSIEPSSGVICTAVNWRDWSMLLALENSPSTSKSIGVTGFLLDSRMVSDGAGV